MFKTPLVLSDVDYITFVLMDYLFAQADSDVRVTLTPDCMLACATVECTHDMNSAAARDELQTCCTRTLRITRGGRVPARRATARRTNCCTLPCGALLSATSKAARIDVLYMVLSGVVNRGCLPDPACGSGGGLIDQPNSGLVRVTREAAVALMPRLVRSIGIR